MIHNIIYMLNVTFRQPGYLDRVHLRPLPRSDFLDSYARCSQFRNHKLVKMGKNVIAVSYLVIEF